MSEEDAFLLDILSNPDDDTARLVYCDWLLDRDDPRADIVREVHQSRGDPQYDHARLSVRWKQVRNAGGWQDYDGLLLTWEQILLLFRFRLAEAIEHCSASQEPMRTEKLEPRSLLGFSGGVWPRHPDIWDIFVRESAHARRRALQESGRAPDGPATEVSAGQFVLFDPWSPVVAEVDTTRSRYYFDADTAPTWDAWVFFVPETPDSVTRPESEGYVLAWVPFAWLAHAVASTSSPERWRSVVWAHETNTPFLQRLRAAGVSGV